MKRFFGILFFVSGVLSLIGGLNGARLPTLRVFFEGSKSMGVMSSLLLVMMGIFLYFFSTKGGKMNPVTERRWQNFKSIKRGYYSYLILIFFFAIVCLDHLLVGKRALVVRYEGEWHFPAFSNNPIDGEVFGLKGEEAKTETNYRKLKKEFQKENKSNWVWMPLIPFDPTLDKVEEPLRSLEEREGVTYLQGSDKPYSGLATKYFDAEKNLRHIEYRYRDGKKQGLSEGWNRENVKVYTARWDGGELVEGSVNYTGEGSVEDYLALESSVVMKKYHWPIPPLWSEKMFLGSNSSGEDILAHLYGGLQINIRAALFYIPFVYFIGVTVGLLMGYFGGAFDITVQRLIEIFSNMPFLYVIIILSSTLEEDKRGLTMILIILILFGWMGMTYFMRTAAYREKAKDYISAARALGATTPRVLFRHILPNIIAILVTLIPFSISGIILALTSLDYLGFGLPPRYASWGRLLNDGLANLSAPWIVSSVFVALVVMLILVTFVGEAVREAYDPKKYTIYQ